MLGSIPKEKNNSVKETHWMEKILVIGSSNTDMIIKSKHIPRAGETILGGTFFHESGRKRIIVIRWGEDRFYSCF